MNRIGCWLGVALMLIAFGVLLVLVVIPALPGGENNKFFTSKLEPFFCKSGETLTEETLVQSDLRGTVSSPRYYCVNQAGEPRDVTEQTVIYGIIGFVVPFIAGLIIAMGGLARGMTRGVQGAVSDMLDDAHYTVDKQGTLLLNDRPVSFPHSPPAMPAAAATAETVAAKLRQLDDLHDQDVITDDEYTRLRAQVLDESF